MSIRSTSCIRSAATISRDSTTCGLGTPWIFCARTTCASPRAGGGAGLPTPTLVSSPENELDPLWNDFHSAFRANVPDGEEELAHVLADAIGAVVPELPEGFHFGCTPDACDVEVEAHKPDNSVDKRLVAVCNASTRSPAFVKQIAELEDRAGEIPVAIVRTTDFPKTGKAIAQDCQHAETPRAKSRRRRRGLAGNAGVRGIS